jgi:chromosome segregation ATPase
MELESIIFGLKETVEEQKTEIEHNKTIIKLLEMDIDGLQKELEQKVEDVYPGFMRDYKIMRDELNGLYDENADLREDNDEQQRIIFGLEEEKRQLQKQVDELKQMVDVYFTKAVLYYHICKGYGIENFHDEELEAKPTSEGKTITFPKFESKGVEVDE